MKIPNEPIGATGQWRAAVLAAKLTCQCHAGECGKRHTATGGACDERLHQFTGVRLHLVDDEKRGPIVVCSTCFDGRRTIANRAAKAAAAERLEDFALFAADDPAVIP